MSFGVSQDRRYERLHALGSGATAETFLAKDRLKEGRQVALKIFREEWAAERPDLIDHELKVLASLSHPYIASIEDFGEDFGVEGGGPYLVTEFIEGETLIDHLRDADLNTVIWRFTELLEALDYLYFRNVVHLDLKPANVLIQQATSQHGSRVKLIDFGLAALTTAREDLKTEAIGTPPYTAPEFALRRGVDTKSDLYSVGVLLYRALAGKDPYEGGDPIAILNQQLTTDPIPLKDRVERIPPGLSAFVDRLLARDPLLRFENPHQALLGLQEAIGEMFSGVKVSPVPLFEDPDLVFRGQEYAQLFQEIQERGGRWAIQGEAGSGKTFLARWLERSCWKERASVVSWNGERVVLSSARSSPEQRDLIVIVDDADRGPVVEWVDGEGFENVIALGQQMEGFWSAGWNRVTLEPIPPERVQELITASLGKGVPEKEWKQRSRGMPRGIIQTGLDWVRRGRIHKEGIGWKWHEGSDQETETPPSNERLLQILSFGQISLDAETLALWTDLSVAEVEATIQDLLKEGVLERTIAWGRSTYRVSEDHFPTQGTTPFKTESTELLPILKNLYDEGRYQDGLDLFKGIGNHSAPAVLLTKAKFLTGAGRYREALDLLSEDLSALLSPAEQVEALETKGKAELFLGDFQKAHPELTEATHRYGKLQDRDGEVRALMHVGILLQRSGDNEGARSSYEKALRLASEAQLRNLLQGVVKLNLANLCYDRSEWEEADRMYQACLQDLKQTRDGPLLAQAYINWANLSFYMGRLQESAHLCREALRIAVDHRYLLTQGRALLLLAMIDESRGDPPRQGERLDEAVVIFRRAGLSFEEAQALIQRAYFHESMGRVDEAVTDAKTALAKADAVGAMDLASQACLILGKVLGHRGEMGAALEYLERAERHLSSGKNLQLRWECEFERGELARRQGDVSQAAEFFEQALKDIDHVTKSLPPLIQESFLRDRKRERIVKALQEVKGGING